MSKVCSPILLGHLLGIAERQVLASSVKLLALDEEKKNSHQTMPKSEPQEGQGPGLCFARYQRQVLEPPSCSLLAL